MGLQKNLLAMRVVEIYFILGLGDNANIFNILAGQF